MLRLLAGQDPMKRRCAVCMREFGIHRLHRVGGRILCPECFRWLQQHPRTEEPLLESLGFDEEAALKRLDVGLTFAGTFAKAAIFAVLILWAHRSETGAAVVGGVAIADVLTWMVFTALDWPFRRVHTVVGAFVQIAIIVVALRVAAIDEVTRTPDGFAFALVAFLFYLPVKSFVWFGETALEMRSTDDSDADADSDA